MTKNWKLLEPFRLGPITLKNRMVMAPMETRLFNPLGDVTPDCIDYYAARAKGGVSMIIIENTFVDSKASRSSLVSSGLNTDHLIAGKSNLAEAIHDHDAKVVIQLSHGGRQASAGATGLDCVAPSAVPCKTMQRMPKALTIEEIVEIEDCFAQAAGRAKTAGFDGVEIHGAHGYLICSFLSPYTNKRTDDYGGSFGNRARFPLNIIRKIRERVGDDFIVGYRISADEYVDGGIDSESACTFGKLIEDEVDYIHVSAGNYESIGSCMITPVYIPQRPIVHLAAAMKRAVKCPVIAVGALDAQLAEEVLGKGEADLVAFGRALIADPDIPNKIKNDRLEDIRPCIRGNEGCISLFFTGRPIRCEVNPACGREGRISIKKTDSPKNIVIIGGGMAGMEAARYADQIGHRVTLIEKSGELGGHYIEATAPSFKQEGAALIAWAKKQLEKSKVSVIMNTEATPNVIDMLKPDALIIAVGSKYIAASIPGIDTAMKPSTALLQPETTGQKVVVIGGGMVGAETALNLAQKGKEVIVLEMGDSLVPEDEPLTRGMLIYKLAEEGVNALTGSKVVDIRSNGVTYIDKNGVQNDLSADTVVAALGLAADKATVAHYGNICDNTFVVGDARKGGKVFDCFHQVWTAVQDISL
ncbi:MAG: hypothetical protein A2X80_10360 [Geobacteraceae bacterium GWB2_52_12]|nr:MAG: hypothetical protein A2X80_10360 [Geobacteraceae bacterium GWB2_52_12]